jgi:hypothetical protein
VVELETSDDFRVRVNAALFLGRSRLPSALEPLEHALASDPHPAVRSASAEALASLGDPSALSALEQRARVETSASVKAQLRVSIAILRPGASAPQPTDDDGAPRFLPPDARCVLSLGSMRNASGVRGDDLGAVLASATQISVRAMRGVVVAGTDAPVVRLAARRRIPLVLLDGSLVELQEAKLSGGLQVRARVQFTVRRDQSLRGTLSGSATTFGSSPTLSDDTVRRLEEQAIEGAVQGALRGAEAGIIVAAR